MSGSGNGQLVRDVCSPIREEAHMATIRREFRSPRPVTEVWARLRDFSKVHELARGFVVETRMEPSGARLITFANGMQVREWLVSSDEAEHRLVYAITDNPNYQHYSAAAQVFADGAGSRFVWTVDFLPDAMVDQQAAAMDAGAAAMQAALS
jgi:hypothetical protein